MFPVQFYTTQIMHARLKGWAPYDIARLGLEHTPIHAVCRGGMYAAALLAHVFCRGGICIIYSRLLHILPGIWYAIMCRLGDSGMWGPFTGGAFLLNGLP